MPPVVAPAAPDARLTPERLGQVVSHAGDGAALMQSSIMGVAFFTPNGRFLWGNQALLTMFGVESEQMPTSMECFYTSREQYLSVGRGIDACVRSGQDYRSEQLMRRLDGRLFWVLLSGTAVDPTVGEQGTVWTMLDISEYKALERTLQQTAVEREAILNNTLVGISYNRNRCIEWVNDKYLEMTGFTRSDIIGKSSRMFYATEEDYLADGEAIMAALLSVGCYASERRIARKNGDKFWIELFGRCLLDKDPSAGVIWTMLDVTQRRQAADEIRASLSHQQELNALRSRFVSMTSHEFRTPLAAILSSTELLRYYGERMDPTEKRDMLKNIEQAVQRMTQMLERVMLIGKSDAEMLECNPRELNLQQLCQDILTEAMSEQQDATYPLHFRFELPNPMGRYDEKLLRHIFSNLLSNAIKYSPQGEPVEFRVYQDGGRVAFEVIDRGIGIPASEIPHLYDSFHRASNVGNIPGTGLGLPIVKKSVELHGGTIEVHSSTAPSPTPGTRFIVRL